jgi:predicted secreted protein
MGPISGVVVFLMVWWTALFAVLPWGNRRSEEPIIGNTVSAPDKPKLLKKFLITTLVSVIIWLVIYGLISSNVISFYDMAADMEAQDQQQQMNAQPNTEIQK